jgi:hypothetical protein
VASYVNTELGVRYLNREEKPGGAPGFLVCLDRVSQPE